MELGSKANRTVAKKTRPDQQHSQVAPFTLFPSTHAGYLQRH